MSRIAAKTDPFRAIADPTRRAILDRLRAGPANAGTLAADFRSSRPAVSKHLKVLREARLVTDTKVGRERVYVVNPVPLQSVAGWLEGYRMFWQASLMRLKRNLEEKRVRSKRMLVRFPIWSTDRLSPPSRSPRRRSASFRP